VADPSRDPLDRPATPARLRVAFDAASLPDAARRDGFAIVDRSPLLADWSRFLRQALLLIGAALVLSGVVSFFAFNWASLGRFGKFLLLDAAIVVAALVGWRARDRLSGKVALAAAAVLVGPLLAVYGQTYQTGADPWGLFAAWAFLVVPWTLAARFTALWALEVVLVDTALALYWIQVAEPAHTWQLLIFTIVAAFHAACVAAWEWQRRRDPPWLDEAWGPRLLVVTGLVALTIPASAAILDPTSLRDAGTVGLAALASALGAAFWYYRHQRFDLFMLTATCGTVVVMLAMAFGRLLIGELDLGVLGPFVMAMFVIAEVAVAVTWLRRVMQEGAAA
jgi:uncharacterized membrane protein